MPLNSHDPSVDPVQPLLAAILLAESGAEHELPSLLHQARAAAAGGLELVVVDRRLGGNPLAVHGAKVLTLPGGSRGGCWIAGVEAAQAPLVVLLEGGARLVEGGLDEGIQALESEPEVGAAIGDVALLGPGGETDGVVHPFHMGDAPCAGWLEATVWRREALEDLQSVHFHPVELQLYQDLRRAGRVVAVDGPAAAVTREGFEAETEHQRRRSGLLGLHRRSRSCASLELSVIVHGREGMANIERTLASLARQLVKPGTFELVLAAQAELPSTDRILAHLKLELPHVFVRTAGTPGAVLEAALSAARAPLVLFLRAGSVADHDLVERHLRFHAKHSRAALLGGIVRPDRGVELALSRHLSSSSRGAPRRSLDSGASVPPEQFECSNLSVPRAELAAVGGPDPVWACTSNCDIDLGARLAATGIEATYRPEARVKLANRTTFTELNRDREESWNERLRLYLRHPRLLRRSDLNGIPAQDMADRLAELDAVAIPVEAAAAELGTMDVGSLERLGPEFESVALETVDRLEHLLGNLEERWCLAGVSRGLLELGLDSMEQLSAVAEAGIPPLEGKLGARVLCRPDWSDEAHLRQVLAMALPLASTPGATLYVRVDPGDPAAAHAGVLLQRGLEAVYGRGGDAPNCVCLAGEISPEQWLRLSAEFSSVLVTAGTRDLELRQLGLKCLGSPEELDAWCGRFEWEGQLEAQEVAELDLSVVITSNGSPQALDQLLLTLAAQDLEPERFEVCVVDNGSPEPLSETLPAADWPFRMNLLSSASPTSPAAARNLGLAGATGRLVLFFEPEARPEPSCLRLHLESHAGLVEPRAVQGATPTHERYRGDALVEYCERTGLHGGRPPMKPGLIYGGAVLSTNNLSVERSALIAVGGFDESFPLAGGEETDLGLRLEAALGVKVLYLQAPIAHLDRRIEARAFAHHQRVLGWSAYRLAIKHDTPSLAFGGAEAIDDRLIGGLVADLRGTDQELEQLIRHLERLAANESPVHDPELELRSTIERIAFLEYARGLAAAHRDRLPFEEAGGSVPPLGELPEGAENDDLANTAYTRMVLAHAQRLAEREARDSAQRPTSATLLMELPETLKAAAAGRLYELARTTRSGAILAIGCDGTRAAVALGGGASDGRDLRVYAVQPDIAACAEGRETFLHELQETGCQRSVRLLDLAFDQLVKGWSEPIGLLVLGRGAEHPDLGQLAEHLTPEAAVAVVGPRAEGGEPWLSELLERLGFEQDAATEQLSEYRVVRSAAGSNG